MVEWAISWAMLVYKDPRGPSGINVLVAKVYFSDFRSHTFTVLVGQNR